LQKRKIITVVLVVAVVVIATVGYEFFVANSLSGYTKVSITTLNQPYSIKFGAVQYNITLGYTFFLGPIVGSNFAFVVSIDNSSKGFAAIQGHRYSFSGLQIVVGSINSNQSYSQQLILYLKSTVSNSEPIISFPAT
jgi:hypothetical protein